MSTVVGETIRISGHLGGDEDLTVRGRVEGRIELTRTLIVEPSGIIKAEVSVRNAIVSGVVVGNVTASDSVELTADARVVGDITAPRVIIVDGASFKGRVDMGDLEMARASGSRPAMTARPTVTARPVARPVSAPISRPPPPPPRAMPEPARVEVKAAAAAPARSAKAPAAPPRPPPPSVQKRKVKVKKRR